MPRVELACDKMMKGPLGRVYDLGSPEALVAANQLSDVSRVTGGVQLGARMARVNIGDGNATNLPGVAQKKLVEPIRAVSLAQRNLAFVASNEDVNTTAQSKLKKVGGCVR